LQDLLRRAGGQTPSTIATVEFEREVVRALDLDVWDYDMLELMLDELHCLAYPDTATRPARICIEPAEIAVGGLLSSPHLTQGGWEGGRALSGLLGAL
jgi:hypothetical protein